MTQAFGEAVGQPGGEDDAHYLILKMDGNAPELEAAYRTMATHMPKPMEFGGGAWKNRTSRPC